MTDRQVVIVTGSASGIGAATALLLARQGAAVLVNYVKSAAEAERVAGECRRAGGEALVVQADVAQDADCRRLAASAMDAWGRIDGLVNNAGTTKFVRMGDLAGLSAEDFHRIFSVNVIAAYQMVRACEAPLRAARGAVVNVSSIAGSMGIGSSMAYTASKGALNTLTLSLARTLGPDVRVNAVLPGFTDTRWHREELGAGFERAREGYRTQSALRETLTADDVAESIAALLGARKITGQLLAVDAGRGIGPS